MSTGTVTILFTDVVGSSELRTRRGEKAAQQLLEAHAELVRREIEQYSGQEIKALGDGFMVAFPSARNAVDCAVAVQRALAEYALSNPGDEVHVRIGLNTGEAIEKDGDLFGTAVDAAARIMSKAAGGQIFVSEAVRSVIGTGQDMALVDRGLFWLKGSPERWRLYEVLWQEEGASIAAAPPRIAERTPFVGREHERADLRRHLERAKNGHGALLMLSGEPGVGKTRMTEELADEAYQHGFLTLSGHCYEMEGAPPYIPFVEVLESAVRLVKPNVLLNALGEAAPEAAKLMPQLRNSFPDIPPPQQLPPDQERRHLLNSLRDFFERLSASRTLLLIFEDLHWADGSTLMLIEHMAQRVHEMPVLVIGTYRHTELDMAPSLAKTLEELNRRRLIHEIMLKQLPHMDVAAMLHARIGQQPPVRLAELIYRETEGNPFFVEEIFKHLSEEGRLFDEEGRLRSDIEISEEAVPKGIRLVIGRRLNRVSDECRHVLSAAAIIGRAFDFELLEELVDLDEDAVFNAIDTAERAQLIIAAAKNGKIAFKFYHELIRQTLISDLSSIRRQRMHLRVADTMERIYQDSVGQYTTDLAHHLLQAGDFANPQKTTQYLILAGDQARDAAAFEEALSLYGKALSLLSEDNIQIKASLFYKQGLVLRSLGQPDEALTEWEKALAMCDKEADAQLIGQICEALSMTLILSARLQEAYETATRGIAALGECVNSTRCRLLAAAAMITSYTPGTSYDTAHEIFAEALDMAEKLGDEKVLGSILYPKAHFHNVYWECEKHTSLSLQAGKLLQEAGNDFDAANALATAQWGLLQIGRLKEAEKVASEAKVLADRTGNDAARWFLSNCDEFRNVFIKGDLKRYEDGLLDHLEFSRSSGVFLGIPLDCANVGRMRLWRGHWDSAREILQEGTDMEFPGVFYGYCSGLFFLFCAYANDKDAAFDILERIKPNLPKVGQPNPVGEWIILESLVEGLTVLGKLDDAAELYPLTLEAISTKNQVRWSSAGVVQTIAGIAAAAGTQWDKAEEHYQIALRQAHEIPHKIEQPEVRRWYARMLIERDGPGDKGKARTLLSEAIEMYRDIGMPRHLDMAEELMKRA